MRKIIFFCLILILVSVVGEAYAKNAITLSLDEAILLAVRSNPNVRSSELDNVLQKFNVYVQEWQFYPHYAFQAATAWPQAGANNSVQPSVSLTTPIGTAIALTSTNTYTDHYHPGLSLQMTQQLMRGFGPAVVEAALNNARDTEIISCLTIRGLLRNTVSDVINAYLVVMSAEETIIIDEKAVQRAEKSVEQTKLFIQAGHKAGNELVTVEANVASAKMELENDRNNLDQARYALLTAIGIDPNTAIHFTRLDLQRLIEKYALPTLENTKKQTLENDIQYQITQITLHGPTSRNLLVAEDNTRWQLSLTANAATGNGSGGNSGSWFNSANQTKNIGLALQIPIDDQVAKQAVMSAKIALKQADLTLLKEKWSIETSAINGWNLVRSAERALQFARDAEKLQEKTYHVSYQKYLHGLIDSLELQSAQQSLIQSQQALLSAQINYIKALVSVDLLIGNTLKTWHINVRLS